MCPNALNQPAAVAEISNAQTWSLEIYFFQRETVIRFCNFYFLQKTQRRSLQPTDIYIEEDLARDRATEPACIQRTGRNGGKFQVSPLVGCCAFSHLNGLAEL